MASKAALDLDGLADRLELEARRIRIAAAPKPTGAATDAAREHVKRAISAEIARWERCCRNNPPPAHGWDFDAAVLTEWMRIRDALERED